MQSNIWAERAAVVELAEWARDWERQNGKPWAFSDAQSAAHKPVSGQRRGVGVALTLRRAQHGGAGGVGSRHRLT